MACDRIGETGRSIACMTCEPGEQYIAKPADPSNLPVAEIGPETVQGPGIFGQQLPRRLVPGVGIPELGAQDQAAKGLCATGIDLQRVCLGRAGEDRVVVGCCVKFRA